MEFCFFFAAANGKNRASPPPEPEETKRPLTARPDIRIFGCVDDRHVDALLKTLSEPVRRELARLLGEAPLTVGEIGDVLRLPQSTVSRHLKSLRATGLLVERRDGNRTISSLIEPMGGGDQELAGLLNQWLRAQPLPNPVIDRLRQVLRGRNGDEDTFERLAHQWDEMRQRYFGSKFHLEALLGLLPENWHVLDIGTGTGYLLPLLCRQFVRVTAVDPSRSMLSLARQRAQKEGLGNVDFRFGRLENLPLEASTIDAALAILVLHHARDMSAALAELQRVVKPGGILLTVDLAPHSLELFQREMADPVRGLDPVRLVEAMTAAGWTTRFHRPLPTNGADGNGGPDREAPGLYVIKCVREVDPASSSPIRR